uniref:Uncharacterized protein n=1 Tax=Arundo donax TaxID=35708 RepID=A0A0A9CNT1_ARUDO
MSLLRFKVYLSHMTTSVRLSNPRIKLIRKPSNFSVRGCRKELQEINSAFNLKKVDLKTNFADLYIATGTLSQDI